RSDKAGSVERRPDPADRRAWRLFSTDAAAPSLDDSASFAQGVFAEASTGFSQDEQDMSVRLLERVRANLAEDSAPAARPGESDVESRQEAMASAARHTARTRLKRVRIVSLTVVPASIVAGGSWYWFGNAGSVETDNAYVKQDVVSIAGEVTGLITSVRVRDNQDVKAGDVLFTIDTSPYEVAIRQADAQIATAQAHVTASQADVGANAADSGAARDDLASAQANYNRATASMDRLEQGKGRGWGSVRLRIRIGASAWQTSAFPSKELGWIVPVKAAVRRAEGSTEGDAVTVELQF
ncbi:hypothetical protein OY671_007658, partial [Metschnikowia pulcherrima]